MGRHSATLPTVLTAGKGQNSTGGSSSRRSRGTGKGSRRGCAPRIVGHKVTVWSVQGSADQRSVLLGPAAMPRAGHVPAPGLHFLPAPEQWVSQFSVNSKNTTFNVSKIGYKTIKGCMSPPCIITAIKLCHSYSKSPSSAFRNQNSHLWLSRGPPLSPPFSFQMKLLLLFSKMLPMALSQLCHLPRFSGADLLLSSPGTEKN